MKSIVEVYWTPAYGNIHVDRQQYVQVVTQEPENVLKKVGNEKLQTSYIKCPAFQDAVKNSFLVCSPYTVKINIDHGRITTDSLGQTFFDDHIEVKDNDSGLNSFAFSMFPKMLFYSKVPVLLEMQNPVLFSSSASKQYQVVPGVFDISKWIRPIELAVECSESNVTLDIKAGDPLFTVKFTTLDSAPVKLVRVPFTQELSDVMAACTQVKRVRSKLKLPTLYKLAENFLSLLKSK